MSSGQLWQVSQISGLIKWEREMVRAGIWITRSHWTCALFYLLSYRKRATYTCSPGSVSITLRAEQQIQNMHDDLFIADLMNFCNCKLHSKNNGFKNFVKQEKQSKYQAKMSVSPIEYTNKCSYFCCIMKVFYVKKTNKKTKIFKREI